MRNEKMREPAAYCLFYERCNRLNTSFWALAMNYNLAFGIVFRRLRRDRGLTQEDFDAAASVRYVRNLEKGEYSPSLSTLRALCDVLRISPATLACLIEAEFSGSDPSAILKIAAAELHALETH